MFAKVAAAAWAASGKRAPDTMMLCPTCWTPCSPLSRRWCQDFDSQGVGMASRHIIHERGTIRLPVPLRGVDCPYGSRQMLATTYLAGTGDRSTDALASPARRSLSLFGGTPDRAGVGPHVDEPDNPSRVRSSLARAPDYSNAVGLGDTLIPLAQEMSSVAFSSRNERGQDFHRTRTRSRATFAGSGRHFPQDGSRALCACRDAALQRMRLHKRRQWGWRPRAVELLTNSPCLEMHCPTSFNMCPSRHSRRPARQLRVVWLP